MTIILKGKVTGLNKDKDYEGKNRLSLTLQRSSVELQKAGMKKSMATALKNSEAKRRG